MDINLYNKFRDAVGAADAGEALIFAQIVQRVKNLVHPAPLEIAKKFHFHNQ